LRGVEVAFNGRRVLWVPSAVFRGSSVILGPNGAGKTTLMKTSWGSTGLFAAWWRLTA